MARHRALKLHFRHQIRGPSTYIYQARCVDSSPRPSSTIPTLSKWAL